MRLSGALAVLLLTVAAAPADEIRFNRDIRPILSDKCVNCHGHDSANRATPCSLRFSIMNVLVGELSISP